MRARALIVSLAAAALIGLAAPAPAQASDVRVYVDVGDVIFTSGRAYHRHSREPLYVEYHRYGPPRYYRIVEHRYYYGPPGPPRFVPPGHYVRHYGPPPKRYKHRHHYRYDPYYRGRGEVVIRYRY